MRWKRRRAATAPPRNAGWFNLSADCSPHRIELARWLLLRWRYPRDAREPRDEREQLIDLRALRVAYYAFLSASMIGVFVTLHLLGTGPAAVGMVVFMGFVLSQVDKHAARIYFHRRGF